MTVSEKIKFGAKQAIVNCLRVKPSEKVCIITDEKTYHIGNAVKEEALKITPNVKMFKMEDFGERPDDGSNPLKLPDEIIRHVETCQVSIYVAQGKKGELQTFRTPLIDGVVGRLKTIRHGHMIGTNDLIMETGMNADYAKIQKMNAEIMGIVAGAKSAKMTAPAGTDLDIELNPGWKWINSDGVIGTDTWKNLPDGEVFTCVKNINGKMVVDGILGDFLSEKYGLIESTPLTIDIEEGWAKNFECTNNDIIKDVVEYSKMDKNASRIGEFGIGTNTGLTKLIGNLLQDEKFPGAHFSIGHGYPDKTGSDWNSEAHLDLVIQKTTIEIDGRTIMKDGKFCI